MKSSPKSVECRPLDARARTVLGLSATGMNSYEVAEHLGATPDQVRRDISRAIAVLGAGSKLEAVVIALRLGLVGLRSY